MSKTHRHNNEYVPKHNVIKLYDIHNVITCCDYESYCHGHKSYHKIKQMRTKQLRARLKVETNKEIANYANISSNYN